MAQPSLLVEVEVSSRRRVAPASIFAVSIYRTGILLLGDFGVKGDTKETPTKKAGGIIWDHGEFIVWQVQVLRLLL